jgi:hypothetical protein
MAPPFDPKRDLPRIRNVEEWPRRPVLHLIRTASDGERLTAFIRDDDVLADGEIPVFATSRVTWEALFLGTRRLEDVDLEVVQRYDSLERMLADGWEVD